MTRVSRYRGRVVRPRGGFLRFGREGSKTFRVWVSLRDVERIIEEYTLLGWEYQR